MTYDQWLLSGPGGPYDCGVECPECDGSGEVATGEEIDEEHSGSKTCPECDGSGEVSERRAKNIRDEYRDYDE